MIENARGIILRIRPLTETSLIAHWLTPNLGRIATVAKCARRPQSPFQGKLDLFYEADFSFARSRRADLHTLREVSLRKTYNFVREDILKLRRAAYAVAFIEQATETETPLPGMFALLRWFLKQLSEEEPAVQIIFAFELKSLRELGLEPDWRQTNLSAGSQKIAKFFSSGNFVPGARLKLAKTQVQELQRFLHGFLICHLGHLPKGRAAALAEGI